MIWSWRRKSSHFTICCGFWSYMNIRPALAYAHRSPAVESFKIQFRLSESLKKLDSNLFIVLFLKLKYSQMIVLFNIEGSPERAPRRGSWWATALERPEPEGRGNWKGSVDRGRERPSDLRVPPSLDGNCNDHQADAVMEHRTTTRSF